MLNVDNVVARESNLSFVSSVTNLGRKAIRVSTTTPFFDS